MASTAVGKARRNPAILDPAQRVRRPVAPCEYPLRRSRHRRSAGSAVSSPRERADVLAGQQHPIDRAVDADPIGQFAGGGRSARREQRRRSACARHSTASDVRRRLRTSVGIAAAERPVGAARSGDCFARRQVWPGDRCPAASISGMTGFRIARSIISRSTATALGATSSFSSSSANTLARQGHQVVRARRAGVQRRCVGRLPKACEEAEVAQDTQVILRDPLQRIADEADATRGKIVQPAEIVEHFARQGIGIQRVDREIAACGIGAPVVGEGDRRVPPVGRDVAAQRRHLDDGPPCATAVTVPCAIPVGHGLDPRRLQPIDDLLRRMARRDVDVGDGAGRAAYRAPPRRRTRASPCPARSISVGQAGRADAIRHRAASRRSPWPRHSPRQVDDHRGGRAPDPSPLPVDAVEMPDRGPRHSAELAMWFAGSSRKASGTSNTSATSVSCGT